jgi:hypothetical protein
MKLSSGNCCKFNGFMLLSQALSQGLRGCSSFARCLDCQTLSGSTGALQKAVQVKRRLKDRLHPTLCEGLKMADEFEQTAYTFFLQPKGMTYLWIEGIIDENEEHAAVQIP